MFSVTKVSELNDSRTVVMMTREDYYAQIKDMYAQKYELSEPMTTLDCGFVLPESVRQEFLSTLQEMMDNINRFSESMEETRAVSKVEEAMVREKAEALECASNLKIPASVSDMDSHVKEMEEFPHQSTNGSGKKIAHQLFDQMPSKEKQMKCLKAWKFKFKPTSKRSRLMDDKFSFVDATVLLNKDLQEIIWDCVNKEFKETVADCGKKRVDQRKSHKTWMFKYKSEFPRHYGFDIEAFFGVEFYELEYRKLHINHCFAVQEFYGIHGSISGPWHLAFDPGGIISCTACDDLVVTHTQWVGHDKLEGCSNDQTLATDVEVEEKQAWIENAWFKIQSMLVQKRVLLQADKTIIKADLCQLHQLQDTTVSNWAPDCVKQLQQSGNLLFQKVHETLWLTLPIPPANQMKNVHTQIHMVQWVWHCVRHDTQQNDFHVWHRWKNKAEKLEVSLVCSGKRWSFVVYAFYDHTVVLRKEPILSPKIKRGFENKTIAGMSRGRSVKQHHGRDSENAKLYNNNIKRHYTGLVGGHGLADLIVLFFTKP